MLLEGANLMAVGMTAVFSFLTLLVVVLQLSAWVFRSFGHRWPDPVIATTPSLATARPGFRDCARTRRGRGLPAETQVSHV